MVNAVALRLVRPRLPRTRCVLHVFHIFSVESFVDAHYAISQQILERSQQPFASIPSEPGASATPALQLRSLLGALTALSRARAGFYWPIAPYTAGNKSHRDISDKVTSAVHKLPSRAQTATGVTCAADLGTPDVLDMLQSLMDGHVERGEHRLREVEGFPLSCACGDSRPQGRTPCKSRRAV